MTDTAFIPAPHDTSTALAIMAAEGRDIEAFERDLGQANYFADRWLCQWHGNGLLLTARAEEEAARRKHRKLALAVEIGNHRAEKLYSRLGYKEWRHGAVKCLPFPDGTPQAVEVCSVMVKRPRDVAPWRNSWT